MEESPSTNADPRRTRLERRLVRVLILGLLAWGGLLAVGALWFGKQPLKSLILLGSLITFTGLWWCLLRVRPNR